jgi:hypothetical protein
MPPIEGFKLDEPVVGFRTWYTKPIILPFCLSLVDQDTYEDYCECPPGLYPMSNKGMWNKGVNEAVCKGMEGAVGILPEPHTSPHWNCLCGLHANFNYKSHEKMLWGVFGGAMIDGAILMWGEMYAGENVIRAQYAEPLAVVAENDEERKIAEEFGIPGCASYDEMKYVATEQYSPMPSDVYHSLCKITQANAKLKLDT